MDTTEKRKSKRASNLKRRNAEWYGRRDFKLARIEEARRKFKLRYKCSSCGYVSHRYEEEHVCSDGIKWSPKLRDSVSKSDNTHESK